ncbi:hypothetical protein BH09VER1_BH09VER1_55390 [soil metagenome]
MHSYQDYIYQAAREGILAIEDQILPDIYALSFFYWDWDDDHRNPNLTVSYNTNAKCQASIKVPGEPHKNGLTSSPEEAK